jgi:hypothetical protein
MWGLPVVYDGGDQKFMSNSLFTQIGSTMYYFQEWKGNGNGDPFGYFFLQPILWMPQYMSVGDTYDTTNQRFHIDPSIREQTTGYSVLTAEVQLVNHWTSYTVPETGIAYSDVIEFSYNPNTSSTPELYWCANGVGWIRADITYAGLIAYAQPGWYTPGPNHNNSAQPPDPSHLDSSGNPMFETSDGQEFTTGSYLVDRLPTPTTTPVPGPENPWYSPIASPVNYGPTYVVNGSFEDGTAYWTITGEDSSSSPVSTPAQRTSITTFTPPPASGSAYGPANMNNQDQAGTHQVYMEGGTTDDTLLTCVESGLIPVIPGGTYLLSGWVYRVTAPAPAPHKGDVIALEFMGGFDASNNPVADGPGDVATPWATTAPLDTWYYVSVQVTMASDVYSTQIMASRSGFPSIPVGTVTGTYFDDLRLQLISVPSGYTIPGT